MDVLIVAPQGAGKSTTVRDIIEARGRRINTVCVLNMHRYMCTNNHAIIASCDESTPDVVVFDNGCICDAFELKRITEAMQAYRAYYNREVTAIYCVQGLMREVINEPIED